MHLSRLQSLDFYKNELDTIEDGAFNGLHSLINLELNNNNLGESIFTSVHVFANVSDTLISLSLDRNRIHTIYNDMFRKFTKLERLTMTAGHIENPYGFRGLNSLTNLYLSGIEFDEIIPDVWSEISDTLTHLELHNSNVDSLNENMFVSTPSVTYLSLGNNRIATIHPGAFNTLNSLKDLILYRNRITEEGIKNLRSVQQTLKGLQLWHNRITSIPKDTFQNFTLLQYLGLAENMISRLTLGGFNGLQSLTSLWLSSNAIAVVEHGSFSGLSSLRYLYLQYNLLTTLELTAFSAYCMRPPGKYMLFYLPAYLSKLMKDKMTESTRKHSSRMRTIHFSCSCACPTPRCRSPALDADPLTLDAYPPECRTPRRLTPLDADPS